MLFKLYVLHAGTNFEEVSKPTYSSGTRNRSLSDFSEITKTYPESDFIIKLYENVMCIIWHFFSSYYIREIFFILRKGINNVHS